MEITTEKPQCENKGTQVNFDLEDEQNEKHRIQELGKTIKLKNIKKLVFGGGFLKGYALYGCIYFLMENNVLDNVTTYIGSSVGALMLLLLVLDFKCDEIQTILTKYKFKDHENFTIENLMDFTDDFGIDNGEKFAQFIKNIIYEKTKNYYITFKQLYDINKKTFVVTGTHLKLRKCEYFSHLTTPDMPIWIAIRISTSYPFFFTKVNYKGIDYIDGAASSNCSVEFIEDYMHETIEDTLCVVLYNLNKFDTPTKTLVEKQTDNHMLLYIRDLFSSLRYQDFIRFKKYKYNFLELDIDFEFYKSDLSDEEILDLIDKGKEITKSFFNSENNSPQKI